MALLLLAPSLAHAEDLPPGVHRVTAAGALDAASRTYAPGRRLAIVVHGINPVHADLDPLSRDLIDRGYQVLRFVYNDRKDLNASAFHLRRALAALGPRANETLVVAHSMGGLVSRRALTDVSLADPSPRPSTRRPGPTHRRIGSPRRRAPKPPPLPPLEGTWSLVTIASPFGGFSSANWARMDLGMGPAVYDSLGTRSSFIRKPGRLIEGATHLKIETDERGTRRHDGESDMSVGLANQTQRTVDAGADRVLRIALGHVGSIRTTDGSGVPVPLSTILTDAVGPTRNAPTGSTGFVGRITPAR